MRPDRFLALAALLCAPPVLAGPEFRPVETPRHEYSGGWEHFVGGGLAAFDCDADGLPELLAAGGETSMTLLRNRSQPEGNISFEADTPDILALKGTTGAYPIDIDNDGILDLVILRVGRNRVFRGGPECTFFDLDDPGLVFGDGWTTAFSAIWEAENTLPTLAFGNYVNRDDPDGPFEACDSNFLYRPGQDGYDTAQKLEPGYCALSMLFSDWGRQGRADLRISNDRHYYVRDGSEQLWAMEETPRLLGADDGWAEHRLWGMGIAARDLTGDGLPEVFLTSMGDQRLQMLVDGGRAGPTFVDVPFGMGTTAQRPYAGGDGRPSTGWHVAFGDVQNDGRDDIFISKGNVEQMPDSAMDDPNNLLIQQSDGTFSEAGDKAGVASLHRGRGAALVDMNADGLLDLAVVNRRAPLEIWQNVTAETGHWIAVSLDQPGINRFAIGAWIELNDGKTIRVRELTIGGGHAGGTATPEHFGLGTAGKARLRVTWPDGTSSRWLETETDRTITVTRKEDGATIDP